ncbi:ribosome biogenesis protein Nop16 [Lanmaoa asiatica]|nr:ribosome biogenesis protein Nop16 [Lanmaoa asiatica]
MANPRQRRKAKSSTHKAISHSKRAKRLQKKMPVIRAPKALQDAWDPTKTLCQNYLALGLQHDLNPISSGGSEVNLSRTIGQNNTCQLHPTAPSSIIRSSVSEGLPDTSALPKGFGRIIRDSSGDVVRVELPSDGEAGHVPKQELVIDTPVVTTESELRVWAHDPERWQGAGSGDMEDTIVQDLKNLAASATVRERYMSLGERSYLDRLVKKYGDDFYKMACDRRLNPEQRTANELRRAIAKAGGLGALCKSVYTNVTE